jgi:hypothetical protein
MGIARSADRNNFRRESHNNANVVIWLRSLVYYSDAVACRITNADWIFCIADANVKSRTSSPTSDEVVAALATLAVVYRNAVCKASRCAGCQCNIERNLFTGLKLAKSPYSLVAIDHCTICRYNRSSVWRAVGNNYVCQRLITSVGNSDLVISIFANLYFFRSNLDNFTVTAANACAPLARD